MADNGFDQYGATGSYAADDPARFYTPNTYTAGLTQQDLEALWSKGQDYRAEGHAMDDPGGKEVWGKYVDLGGDGKELQLLRNQDGSIYAVPKLNHGWNAAFAELALPILTAGAAAAYGVAGAGAAGTSAGVGEGASGVAGASGEAVPTLSAAEIGNPLYGSAESMLGQFPTMNVAGGAAGAGALGAAGGGGGGGAVGGSGTSSIGGSEAAYGWNPEGYTGGTPSLAGGGFGGTGNVGAGGMSGLLDGMSTNDWLQLGGSLLNGYLGNRAANNALDAQLSATRDSNALLKYMYDQTRTDNMPALQARNAGLTGYQNLLSNPSKITSDPGYQFGLDQGTKALNSQAAAKGSYYSGAQLKALNQFGQDYGQTKFDQSLNRFGNLAGLGQVGAQTTAQAGMNYGNQASNNLIGAGNARGAASMAGSNAWQNALNSYLGYQQYKNMFGG